jgi:hypothetical protein
MFDETQSIDETIASRSSLSDELSENISEEELQEDDFSAMLEELEEETGADTLEAEDNGFDALEESEESVPEEKAAIAEDELSDTLEFDEEFEDETSVKEETVSRDEDQIQDEALADMLEEDEETVDLDALNEEIEAALDDLDEEDLLSELDESDFEGLEDDFSSISANALKLALGEEIPEELEEDEEELEIQEALNALDFMIEEEDTPELVVGQSEFASLHEEALNEAMDELDEIQGDHPELDEIDAFVDQVPVGGDALAAFNDASSGKEGIAALEKLIATLKQENVKEALNGMKMNITISFGENEI